MKHFNHTNIQFCNWRETRVRRYCELRSLETKQLLVEQLIQAVLPNPLIGRS